MASQASGRTYGFGRVSGATRPSPYSPLHARSHMEVPLTHAVQRPAGASRVRLVSSMLAMLVGGVLGLSAYLWYFEGARDPVQGAITTLSEAPPLTEEAHRLRHSALVVHGMAAAGLTAPTISAR